MDKRGKGERWTKKRRCRRGRREGKAEEEVKENVMGRKSRGVREGEGKSDCRRRSLRKWRRGSRKWRRRRSIKVRLTSCRTSAAVRCPAAALPDSSHCCRSACSASPLAGSPPHTWYTPPYLCLGGRAG